MYTIKANCNTAHRQIVFDELKSYIEDLLRNYVFNWNKYNIRSHWRTLKAFAGEKDTSVVLSDLYKAMNKENKESISFSDFCLFMEK